MKNIFNPIWKNLELELNDIITEFSSKNSSSGSSTQNSNEPLEEILQLLRKQNNILSNPENLIPADYIEKQVFSKKNLNDLRNDIFDKKILQYFIETMPNLKVCLSNHSGLFSELNLNILLDIFKQYAIEKNSDYMYKKMLEFEIELYQCVPKPKEEQELLFENRLNYSLSNL